MERYDKNKIFRILLVMLILLIIPLVYASGYGSDKYGCGLYGIGCSQTPSVVGGGGGNEVGGGASEKTTAYFKDLKAGVETEKQLLDQKTAFTKIAITAKEDVKSVKLTIEKKEAVPEGVKEPADKVYQLIDIKLETDVELKAKLCFSVEEEWLKEKEAKKEDVVLAHYKPRIVYKLKPGTLSNNELRLSFAADEEEWEELPTEIVKQALEEQNKKIDYCAETKQFSMYAIIAKKPEEIDFFTVIKPIVEEQIIAPKAVIKERKGIDWRALRNYIMASIDAVLLLLVALAFLFREKLFPIESYCQPAVEEEELPPLEEIMPPPVQLLLTKEQLRPNIQEEQTTKIEPMNYNKILFDFAKDSLLKGYSENDIRGEMSRHGITDALIESIINLCHNKICTMSRDELLPHVIDIVMSGYSAADIGRIYAKNGVSSSCIESVIRLARREISVASEKSLLPFAKKCITNRAPTTEIIRMLVKHGVNKTAAESLVRKARSFVLKKQRHLNN